LLTCRVTCDLGLGWGLAWRGKGFSGGGRGGEEPRGGSVEGRLLFLKEDARESP